MEVNEMILRFKLRVIQDIDLRENAYNYVMKIKNMETRKISDEIRLYIQYKERDNSTELKILYGIILSYLNQELQFRIA